MNQTIDRFFSKNQLGIVLIIIGVFARLIPHIPNMTPLVCISLFAGACLSRRAAFLSLFTTLFISDIGLALLFGYPVFSYWTLFTYTGFAMIVLIGSTKPRYSWQILPIYIFGSSLYFWIWTNLGVWLTSNLYHKTSIGLVSCYVAALPFLRNSLIGDMVWGLVIFGVYYLVVVIDPGLFKSHHKAVSKQ